MNAAIMTVGDEILIGQIVDTNSAWLGQKLTDLGISVVRALSVGDDHKMIINGLEQCLESADIVFMTGGLGPTKDDITKKALADFLGVGLYFHQPTFDRIKAMFEKLGRKLSDHHHDQCLMPEGADILRNAMGTAPGMMMKVADKRIISMPGVPFEMKSIMEEVVLPMLAAESDTVILHRTILTCGAGETHIENAIADIVGDFPPALGIAYLPAIGQVRLRLTAKGNDKASLRQDLDTFTKKITDRISDLVYGYDGSSLEAELKNICTARGIFVATAESCTGGNVAATIVSVPGSSAYFSGGTVAYANDIKIKTLGVSPETLLNYGAVSEETVIEMARGVIALSGADVSVAVSGIAGPEGGTPEKPVGTIWICAGNTEKHITYLLKSGKDRKLNIEAATTYSLILLRRFILDNY